jgi:Tfp pilus assembly protein PilV
MNGIILFIILVIGMCALAAFIFKGIMAIEESYQRISVIEENCVKQSETQETVEFKKNVE